MVRSTAQKIKDFITFPLRAFTLFEKDHWGLSSLMTERFDYVAGQVQGYCLDVGCGRYNIFIHKYCHNNGKGIDVFPHEGLKPDEVSSDLTTLPFPDRSFRTVSFIANINHIPQHQRLAELKEAYRCLQPGGNIVITMGNPLAETLVHHIAFLYAKSPSQHSNIDNHRELHEHNDENYYLLDSEIIHYLKAAGFANIAKKFFWTQWGLNHMLIGWKL